MRFHKAVWIKDYRLCELSNMAAISPLRDDRGKLLHAA
jgi:hypothetical protein